MNDDIGLPKLWTLKEVSEQTGFALRTLQRDCRAGRVTHIHRGRDRLMTTEQVQALIAQHVEQPQTPAAPAISDADKRAAYREAALKRAARKLARNAAH